MTDPKLRLFLLRDFFFEQTDDQHTVTVPEIIAYLASHGILADRRTVYADIERLRGCGMDIEKRRTKTHDYYLAARDFELPELKLLVDAVQSCRFLTRAKSQSLIEKLERLASRHQAAQLSRQVYVQNRVKTGNERIYYNVDSIHTAIQSLRKISFQYCQYTMDKALAPRRDGALYVVSPYLLTWAEDNYYLIADHPEHTGLAHFRVDKMLHVGVLAELRAPLDPLFDPAAYAKSMFFMYAGEREWLELRFANALIGVVIDRFGLDVQITQTDDASFYVRAPVAVSPAFYGWLAQFGAEAEIISPASARQGMAAQLADAAGQYK